MRPLQRPPTRKQWTRRRRRQPRWGCTSNPWGRGVANRFLRSRRAAPDECEGRKALGTGPCARVTELCDNTLEDDANAIASGPPDTLDMVEITGRGAAMLLKSFSRKTRKTSWLAPALPKAQPCPPAPGENRGSKRSARTLAPALWRLLSCAAGPVLSFAIPRRHVSATLGSFLPRGQADPDLPP